MSQTQLTREEEISLYAQQCKTMAKVYENRADKNLGRFSLETEKSQISTEGKTIIGTGAGVALAVAGGMFAVPALTVAGVPLATASLAMFGAGLITDKIANSQLDKADFFDNLRYTAESLQQYMKEGQILDDPNKSLEQLILETNDLQRNEMKANGETVEDINANYPQITEADLTKAGVLTAKCSETEEYTIAAEQLIAKQLTSTTQTTDVLEA